MLSSADENGRTGRTFSWPQNIQLVAGRTFSWSVTKAAFFVSAVGSRSLYSPCVTEVRVFWDLDNVKPCSSTIEDIAGYVAPLHKLCKRLGKISSIQAWANINAFNYVTESDIVDRELAKENRLFNSNQHESGFDPEAQVLRCGMCGSKLKSADDLTRHMKRLHERERSKILQRAKKSEAQKEKLAAYNAARLFVTEQPSANQLKNRLEGLGVRVIEVERTRDAADLAIFSAVTKAVSRLDPVPPSAASDEAAAAAAPASAGSNSPLPPPPRLCVVIVSEDRDFVPLLRLLRQRAVASVVASYDGVSPRSPLSAHCDAVMSLGALRVDPVTDVGAALLAAAAAADDENDDDDASAVGIGDRKGSGRAPPCGRAT